MVDPPLMKTEKQRRFWNRRVRNGLSEYNNLFLSSLLNSSNFLKRSFKSLFLNKYQLFSLLNISSGPFLQLLDITAKLLNPASINTNPGSSQRDVRIKQSALFKYL